MACNVKGKKGVETLKQWLSSVKIDKSSSIKNNRFTDREMERQKQEAAALIEKMYR